MGLIWPTLLLALSLPALGQTTTGSFNAQTDQDQGAFNFMGTMVDVTNSKSFQNGAAVYDGVQEAQSVQNTVNTLKAAQNTANFNPATFISEAAAKEALGSYKSSVVGFSTWVNSTLKKVQTVLDNVNDRVNRWRTTLPALKGYAESAGSFIENTSQYIASFEVSDLWDLDQTFFKGLEDRARVGQGLGISFFNYILGRKDGFGQWANFFDAFYSDQVYPFALFYTNYSLARPEVKDLPNEDRVGMMAIMEARTGMQRLKLLSDEEYQCDESDAELDCANGPKTRRELYLKRFMQGFQDPDATTEDIDKVEEQIASRRLQLASKRMVVQEVNARMQLRYNDVLAYNQAQSSSAQKASCLSIKATMFDPYNTSLRKYSPNTCDDVVTFDGNNMSTPQPVTAPVN